MDRKVMFKWQCPNCGNRHKWYWDEWEVPRANDKITMICDGCEEEIKMTCELIEDESNE